MKGLVSTIDIRGQRDVNLVNWNGSVSLWSSAGDRSVSPSSVALLNGQWTDYITLNAGGDNVFVKASIIGISGISNYFTVSGVGSVFGSLGGEIKNNAGDLVAGNVEIFLNGATNYQFTTDTGAYQRDKDIKCGFYEMFARHTATGNESQRYNVYVPCDQCATQDVEIPFCINDSLTPVILVPGIAGTTAFDTLYPVLPKESPAWDSDSLKIYPADYAGWISLINLLVADGYQPGCNLFGSPYDWRMDLNDSWVKYLKPRIEQAKAMSGQPKVNIVAHSMGGLLTRAYIQSDYDYSRNNYKNGYEYDIEKFMMVGTPNKGSSNTYYLWEGGDPKLLDDIVSWGPMLGNFYWNMTEKNYEQSHDDSIWHGQNEKIWNYYTGGTAEGDNEKNALMALKQLLPTYDFLRHNKDDGQIEPLQLVQNDFLIDLNNSPNKYRMGQGTGKVDTYVFVGVDIDLKSNTIQNIDVSSTCGFTLYKDGYIVGDEKSVAKKGSGDGTVLDDSASLPDTEGWAAEKIYGIGGDCSEHARLIKCFAGTIVDKLKGTQAAGAVTRLTQTVVRSSSDTATTADTSLAVSVRGRVQPYLINPSGLASGINNITGLRENSIPGGTVTVRPDSGSITIQNPVDGDYTLYLKGIYNEDYNLSVSFMDSAGGIEHDYTGFNHADTISFTLTVDSGSVDKITVNYTPVPPTGLQADAVDSGGLMTRLTWDASAVDHYNIYSKYDDEPYLSQIGTSTTNSFDTGHAWAEDSTIKTRLYAVSAVKADSTESFLSNMVENNDRDHDGLTDEEETSYGTDVSNPDTDGDGLKDGEEYVRGTNPLLTDTDGDGYSDYDEVQLGSDPLDVNSKPCNDMDGDGYAVEGGICGLVDCDDSNAEVNPGKTEGPFGDVTCSDTWDNDCDGFVDSADSGCKAPDDVSGCIDLGGSPLVNKKVTLKQTGEVNQTTTTDSGGCYGFSDAVSGKSFTVQVNGTVLTAPVPVIHGCADLQGSAMSDRKVLLKQNNELNKSTKTGADGCYNFTDAVPDKNFKVLIKGPVVP